MPSTASSGRNSGCWSGGSSTAGAAAAIVLGELMAHRFRPHREVTRQTPAALACSLQKEPTSPRRETHLCPRLVCAARGRFPADPRPSRAVPRVTTPGPPIRAARSSLVCSPATVLLSYLPSIILLAYTLDTTIACVRTSWTVFKLYFDARFRSETSKRARLSYTG